MHILLTVREKYHFLDPILVLRRMIDKINPQTFLKQKTALP